MEKKLMVVTIGILLVFALGLVGVFLFSNGLPDGLDRTLEDNNVEEGEPVYTAPLDYGEGYVGTLIMGVVGFFLTLLAVLGALKLRKASKNAKE